VDYTFCEENASIFYLVRDSAFWRRSFTK